MRQLTGHLKVDALAQINFQGDITPKSWYKHVIYHTPKGETKVDRLAIDILADIVYWYRPFQKRDEITGEVIGWQKKFAEDLLRRSPEAFAESLNTTPRCIRESMKVLEQLGLIQVICKPVYTQYGCIPNVMHIDIDPEAIASITYRQNPVKNPETLEKSLLTKWVTRNDEMSNNQLRNEEVPVTKQVTHPYIEISNKISLETSAESKAPPSQKENQPLKIEVLEPEQEVIHSYSSSLVNSNQVFGSNEREIGEDNYSGPPVDKRFEKLIDKLDSGEITDLPRFEKRELAKYMFGDRIRLYRQSGEILTIRAGDKDLNDGFVRFVAWYELKQPEDLSWARNTIKAYENSPVKWGQLVTLVDEWTKTSPQKIADITNARANRGSKEDMAAQRQQALQEFMEMINR